ncbi:MAG: hypothetical protein AAF696_30930 [Bacteroidota bacterium]
MRIICLFAFLLPLTTYAGTVGGNAAEDLRFNLAISTFFLLLAIASRIWSKPRLLYKTEVLGGWNSLRDLPVFHSHSFQAIPQYTSHKHILFSWMLQEEELHCIGALDLWKDISNHEALTLGFELPQEHASQNEILGLMHELLDFVWEAESFFAIQKIFAHVEIEDRMGVSLLHELGFEEIPSDTEGVSSFCLKR